MSFQPVRSTLCVLYLPLGKRIRSPFSSRSYSFLDFAAHAPVSYTHLDVYKRQLLDKPTIYWDFHSLLLGIQMMFSFLLVDGEQPLRLCKHCQKVFLSSRSNSAFCSPRCKNCLLYTSRCV